MSKYFFIGVAGSGMSAIAQYLSGKGNSVSGSDRFFLSDAGNDLKRKLENKNITCYRQGEGVIDKSVDFVVVSTAIESSVPEYKLALELNIPVVHRSDLLAGLCDNNNTVAVCGTSGKSTVTAMIFTILDFAGLHPSMISGAGLNSFIAKGEIGNSAVGKSDILVIETDESDGTIVKYHPQIGLILNIDKDHKEISELQQLFSIFAKDVKSELIVNRDNLRSAALSKNIKNDFSSIDPSAGVFAHDFCQNQQGISLMIDQTRFSLPSIGRYNMENAAAAVAVARLFGVSDEVSAKALESYSGIFRRSSVVYNYNNIKVIDDFAHNPAKIIAQISACQAISSRVIAWFQPHGFAPAKMMKYELVQRLISVLRKDDQFCLSKIFYAGGTADKSISSAEFVDALVAGGCNSVYFENRNDFALYAREIARPGDIILLMGARDNSLADFAASVMN